MPVLAVDAPVLPGATRRSAAVRLALGVLTRGTAGFTGRCGCCRVIVSPYRGGSVCSGGASLTATSARAVHAWAAAPMALCLRARPAWCPCLVVPSVGARAGLLAAVGVVGVSGGGRVPLGFALAVAAASVAVTLAGSAGPCGCCRVIVSPCRGGSVGSGGALPAAIRARAADAWAAAPTVLWLRARPAWWPCLVVPSAGARAGLLAAVSVVLVSGAGRVPLGLALAVAAAFVSVTPADATVRANSAVARTPAAGAGRSRVVTVKVVAAAVAYLPTAGVSTACRAG